MEESFKNNEYQLPVYRKALEIFKISRAVAAYFTEDKHVIEMELSTQVHHRHAGRLVTESLQLAPGIAAAISANSSEIKLKRIKSIRKGVRRLKAMCGEMEFSELRDSEFIQMLGKEVRHLEKLVAEWRKQLQHSSR